MRFRFLLIVFVCVAPNALRAQNVDSQPSNTWIANGTVYSTVTYGDTTYLAGTFTRIGKRTGPLTGLDFFTGQPTPAPHIDDGEVLDLEPEGSGGYFLAGRFTSIDRKTRNGLAHVTALGVVDSAFVPSDFDFATSVVAVGTRLFAAVHQQNGSTLTTAVWQLDRASGSVIAWSPAIVPGAGTDRATELRLFAAPGNALILHGNGSVVALDAASGASLWQSTASLLTMAGSIAYMAGGLEILRLDLTTGAATTIVPSTVCGGSFCGSSGLALFAGRLFVTSFTTTRQGIPILATAAFDPVSGANLNWSVRLNQVTGTPVGLGPAASPTPNQLTVLGDRLVLQLPSKLFAVDPVSAAPTGWAAYVINGAVLDSIANDGQLIVAGNFRGAGGVPRAGLAAVSWPDGAPTAWAPDPPVPLSRAFYGPMAMVGSRLFLYDNSLLRELDTTNGQTISMTSVPAGSTIASAGNRVFVAGGFTTVNGLARRGVASFDVSGPVPVLDSWAPVVAWPLISVGVTNILATENVVLISGTFTDVNGQPRDGLAAIDAVTGAVLPWAPPSRDVSFELSADRLWISGFTPPSPATGGQAAFNFSGELLPWRAAPSPLPLDGGGARTQQHATVFGDRLYVGRGYALEQSTGAVADWIPSLPRLGPFHNFFVAKWAAAPGLGVMLYRFATGNGLFPRVGLPPRPVDLQASTTTTSVALSWQPVVGALSYLIEAGSAPRASNLATIETSAATTSFATAAPPGHYYVRVRARTANGISGPSDERRIVVGTNACGGPPNAPHSVSASVANGATTIRWSAPLGAPPLTHYVVEVRDAFGGNLITTVGAGSDLSVTSTVPSASSYWVRIRAENACGLSEPSDDAWVGL